jgi:alpha-glucosidase (family GH31 glycosyl hydrolase)
MMPFLSNVTYKHPDGFGPVLHPMWLSSNGVLVFVDKAIPLHVSTNTTHLCLQSVPYALGCTPRAAQVGKLTYTVCQFSDVVEAAKHFLQNSGQVERPKTVPDVNVLKMPIWSTGIFLGRNVKENDTCGYINHVLAEKFPISKFGIDCCYSATYGELDIDSDRFPGGFQGISNIANNRFSLSAWVHPFVNYNFDAFEKALKGELGIFLPGGSKETTALVEWKLGHGALINFEMDEALQWYEGKLNEFVRNSHLNALHFYAGESEYLPDCLYFPDSTHPATYTQKYIQFVSNYSSQANLGAEMHVGYFSQNTSMFLRMTERSSTWGLNNGLKSVITTALTLSLAGYNFLIPGIIGGNGTCSNGNFSASCTVSGNSCNSISLDCGATFCDNTTSQRELYIRWMQIATFLPVMHFSIPPWIFKDENLTSYARKLTKFHGSFVDMYILPILEKTVNTTMCPLIRPIWWLDPKSNVALHSDDQFMIGNTIMVAPITEPGVKSRDVYFPPGTWQRCHITDASEETCPSVFIDTKLADRHKQLTIQLLDTRGMVYFKRTAPAAENWC